MRRTGVGRRLVQHVTTNPQPVGESKQVSKFLSFEEPIGLAKREPQRVSVNLAEFVPVREPEFVPECSNEKPNARRESDSWTQRVSVNFAKFVPIREPERLASGCAQRVAVDESKRFAKCAADFEPEREPEQKPNVAIVHRRGAKRQRRRRGLRRRLRRLPDG